LKRATFYKKQPKNFFLIAPNFTQFSDIPPNGT